MQLTDNEQSEYLNYSRKDKLIPDKYHIYLFDDKREAELGDTAKYAGWDALRV